MVVTNNGARKPAAVAYGAARRHGTRRVRDSGAEAGGGARGAVRGADQPPCGHRGRARRSRCAATSSDCCAARCAGPTRSSCSCTRETARIAPSAAGLVRDLEGQVTKKITNNDISFHALRAVRARRRPPVRALAHVGAHRPAHGAAVRGDPAIAADDDPLDAERSTTRPTTSSSSRSRSWRPSRTQVIRDGTQMNVVSDTGQWKTLSVTSLLDDSCRIDPVTPSTLGASFPSVRAFARERTKRLPNPSVVMIVGGSGMTTPEFRSVQSLFGQDTSQVAFHVNLDAPPSIGRGRRAHGRHGRRTRRPAEPCAGGRAMTADLGTSELAAESARNDPSRSGLRWPTRRTWADIAVMLVLAVLGIVGLRAVLRRVRLPRGGHRRPRARYGRRHPVVDVPTRGDHDRAGRDRHVLHRRSGTRRARAGAARSAAQPAVARERRGRHRLRLGRHRHAQHADRRAAVHRGRAVLRDLVRRAALDDARHALAVEPASRRVAVRCGADRADRAVPRQHPHRHRRALPGGHPRRGLRRARTHLAGLAAPGCPDRAGQRRPPAQPQARGHGDRRRGRRRAGRDRRLRRRAAERCQVRAARGDPAAVRPARLPESARRVPALHEAGHRRRAVHRRRAGAGRRHPTRDPRQLHGQALECHRARIERGRLGGVRTRRARAAGAGVHHRGAARQRDVHDRRLRRRLGAFGRLSARHRLHLGRRRDPHRRPAVQLADRHDRADQRGAVGRQLHDGCRRAAPLRTGRPRRHRHRQPRSCPRSKDHPTSSRCARREFAGTSMDPDRPARGDPRSPS